MNKASEIELMYLRRIWSIPSVCCTQPDMFHVCPNCLATRRSDYSTPHASWCAIKREVKAMEQEASEYEISI